VNEQLEARLAELQRDFETGERRLRVLQTEETQLRETLLRIDGAITVLSELLSSSDAHSQASEVRHESAVADGLTPGDAEGAIR
jgi:hypothetical protein